MSALDRWKMIYGFTLAVLLGIMGLAFGLGHVEEKSSYGLSAIIAVLGTMGINFTNWAFRSTTDKSDKTS